MPGTGPKWPFESRNGPAFRCLLYPVRISNALITGPDIGHSRNKDGRHFTFLLFYLISGPDIEYMSSGYRKSDYRPKRPFDNLTCPDIGRWLYFYLISLMLGLLSQPYNLVLAGFRTHQFLFPFDKSQNSILNFIAKLNHTAQILKLVLKYITHMGFKNSGNC
jgi:hypothetical protein